MLSKKVLGEQVFRERRLRVSHLMIIGILIIIPSLLPYASATPTVEWLQGVNPDDAVVISSGNIAGGLPLTVRVTDDVSHTPGIVDTIDVAITSSVDGTGTTLTLVETGTDTNIFKGENFVFLIDPSHQFLISNTVTIQVDGNPDPEDPFTPECDIDNEPTELDGSFFASPPSGVFVYSETESSNFPPGIGPILTETGPNTCRFEGDITFTEAGSSDEAAGILKVSPGDILTFQDLTTGAVTNAQIVPTIDGKGSIHAEIGGTATATYSGVSKVLDILDDGAPGRGGGGLVRPGLVADTSDPNDDSNDDSSNGSGCSGDCTPPTLGIGSSLNRIVSDGFSFNGNSVDVNHFYTPFPLVTVQVGEPNTAILKIYDNRGTQNIAHVELGFGLGKDESFSENRATIILDRTRDGRESVTSFDPDNVLDNISVTTVKDRCGGIDSPQCLVVIIDHTFREPLEFNMVGTQVWDFDLNSWQNFYNHGVHIFGDSLNPAKTKQVAFGTTDMRGLYTLTQIDKIEKKWIDDFGNVYLDKGNDNFILIESIPKQVIDDHLTAHGCDRNCNWFEKYKKNQEDIAQSKIDFILGGKIQKKLPTFTSAPEYSKVSRANDPILQANIMKEIQKAEKLFEKEFDVIHNFQFTPNESISLSKLIQDYQKIKLNNIGVN